MKGAPGGSGEEGDAHHSAKRGKDGSVRRIRAEVAGGEFFLRCFKEFA